MAKKIVGFIKLQVPAGKVHKASISANSPYEVSFASLASTFFLPKR